MRPKITRKTFDPLKLVLVALAIYYAITDHYTAGIIFATLSGTVGLGLEFE